LALVKQSAQERKNRLSRDRRQIARNFAPAFSTQSLAIFCSKAFRQAISALPAWIGYGETDTALAPFLNPLAARQPH